jgi:hypothetical protein
MRAWAALVLLLAAPLLAAPPQDLVMLERFRLMRPLRPPEREGVYAIDLTAQDLQALRPDLGDLRLVDGEGRQVLYLQVGSSRICFRLSPAPTDYRLLLGNPGLGPPRYDNDTEALRRQCGAPVRLSPGPLQANPAYRVRAGDYVRGPLPALLLWGTLLLTLSAVIFLVVRLARRTGPVG